MGKKINTVLIGLFSLALPLIFYIQANEILTSRETNLALLRKNDSLKIQEIKAIYRNARTVDSLCVVNDMNAERILFYKDFAVTQNRTAQISSDDIDKLANRLDRSNEGVDYSDQSKRYSGLLEEIKKLLENKPDGGISKGSGNPDLTTTINYLKSEFDSVEIALNDLQAQQKLAAEIKQDYLQYLVKGRNTNGRLQNSDRASSLRFLESRLKEVEEKLILPQTENAQDIMNRLWHIDMVINEKIATQLTALKYLHKQVLNAYGK